MAPGGSANSPAERRGSAGIEVLRNRACALLTQAVENEVAEFLAKCVDLKTGMAIGAPCATVMCLNGKA